jgi:hypothetical protein
LDGTFIVDCQSELDSLISNMWWYLGQWIKCPEDGVVSINDQDYLFWNSDNMLQKYFSISCWEAFLWTTVRSLFSDRQWFIL